MEAVEFDYIVVGAGSAGCVVAERLSATGHHKVLVLEAGGSDAKFWVKVPLGYGITFSDPTLNWNYHTQPDPGLASRQIYWPRGRVIGGSSTINAMAYVRGLAHDFDDWERAGATGWRWENVKKTYARLERNIETQNGKRHDRGDGPLCVSDLSSEMNPFSARFLQAARDMGWAVNADMNTDGTEGLSYYRSTVRNGYRWSAADAFLRPALKRPNVKLQSGAMVENLDTVGGRVTGVWYRLGDQRILARARREVILSAGAVNSPHLLQVSGVGPAEALRALGIQVQQDLGQVGKGLQDHLAIAYYYHANEPTLNNRLGNRFGQMMAGLQYLATRRGPLSVPVNQVGGFVRSDGTCETPDLQIYCNPASYVTSPTGKPRIDPEPGFLLCAQPCRPTSRGEISIVSDDVRDAPLIQPNSLSTNDDIQTVLRACKTVRALAETPTVRAVTKAAKQPDVTTMSDEQMLEDVRARASTVFHPTCTCRMGNDASDSVLDARLRVHGLRGVRVVDASAFPNITSGNTNAPTLMLAMRAADMILADAQG